MRFQRSGITIIEVLTSIIIATIGVAGVMILIPFAVSQAEQGFSQDMANQLGQNAAADFEVKGFTAANRWRTVEDFANGLGDTTDPYDPADPNPLVDPVVNSTVRCYVIDPQGVAARLRESALPANNNSGYFPFVDPNLEAAIGAASQAAYQPAPPPAPTADTCILIQRASLVSAYDSVFDRGLAESNFTWRDDLVTRSPTATETAGNYPSPELAPPQQVFDVSAGGVALRRQATGKMSYIVVSVPDVGSLSANPSSYPADPATGCADQVVSFRDYILLYRTRPEPLILGTSTVQAYDRVYLVNHPFPVHLDTDPAYYRQLTAGGTVVLSEPGLLSAANANSSQRSEIRSGDWMALTNLAFNQAVNRFVQQIYFYQVLDATLDSSTGNQVVTLQGPDFDLQRSFTAGGGQDYSTYPDFAARVTNAPEYYPSKTYAIHLPDVWTVIERTYR